MRCARQRQDPTGQQVVTYDESKERYQLEDQHHTWYGTVQLQTFCIWEKNKYYGLEPNETRGHRIHDVDPTNTTSTAAYAATVANNVSSLSSLNTASTNANKIVAQLAVERVVARSL